MRPMDVVHGSAALRKIKKAALGKEPGAVLDQAQCRGLLLMLNSAMRRNMKGCPDPDLHLYQADAAEEA